MKNANSLRAMAGLIEDGHLCATDHAALLDVLRMLPEMPADLRGLMAASAMIYGALDDETQQAADVENDEVRALDRSIAAALYKLAQ